MNPIFQQYFDLLWRMFEYDINVFSHPWLYYLALIPAIGYLVFFFMKWTVLTTPLWLPVFLAFQSFRKK
jgi:hypothetical protein